MCRISEPISGRQYSASVCLPRYLRSLLTSPAPTKAVFRSGFPGRLAVFRRPRRRIYGRRAHRRNHSRLIISDAKLDFQAKTGGSDVEAFRARVVAMNPTVTRQTIADKRPRSAQVPKSRDRWQPG
jgi:hypothetical protein